MIEEVIPFIIAFLLKHTEYHSKAVAVCNSIINVFGIVVIFVFFLIIIGYSSLDKEEVW